MKGFIEIKSKIIQGQLPGEMATEWWTEKDWEDWRKHVEELKESGEYGKEVECVLYIKKHPMLDPVNGIVLDVNSIETHEFIPLAL